MFMENPRLFAKRIFAFQLRGRRYVGRVLGHRELRINIGVPNAPDQLFVRSMHTRALVVNFAAIVFFACCSTQFAAVINARTGSLVDVSAAIQLAAPGDTVVVPAGTFTWTAELDVTKNITLQGASVFPFTSGGTIILDNLTGAARTASGAALIKITLSKDTPLFRLSGFEFRNGPTTKTGDLQQEISVNGTSVSGQSPPPLVVGESMIRMDNCKFGDVINLPVIFRDVIGVVDHVVRSGVNEFAQVYMRAWNGKDNGHGSFADDPYWGSSKFLFFEDCQFTNTGTGVPYGIDLYGGARCVSRYNTWQNGAPTGHGTEAGIFRGGKQWEIYNDKYTFDKVAGFPQLRSGTVIMHDNQFTNVSGGMSFQIYALTNHGYTWGKSTGYRSWDNNDPAPTAGFYASGTHTGANGSTLVDSKAIWTTDQWVSPTASYIVINTDAPRDGNGDPELAPIVGNGQHNLQHNSASGIETFNTGQHYQIWKVITSLDQPGQGKGALLTLTNLVTQHIISGAKNTDGTAKSLPYPSNFQDWPQRGYPLEPCYSWNNLSRGGLPNSVPAGQQVKFGNPQSTLLKSGRDFFDLGAVGSVPQQIGPAGAKYLYTPYTYPHPLTAPGDSSPTAPQNLQIKP